MAHRKDEHGLTAKWRALCDKLLTHPTGNAKECYLELWPDASVRSAEVESSKILNRPECKKYLAMRKEQISQATMKDAVWLRERLAEELDADILDLYNEDGSFRPVKDWPEIWRKGLVTDIEYAVDGKIKKIKIVDRGKRLELFGRHTDVGAWKDAPTGPQEVHLYIVDPGEDDEEAA